MLNFKTGFLNTFYVSVWQGKTQQLTAFIYQTTAYRRDFFHLLLGHDMHRPAASNIVGFSGVDDNSAMGLQQ
jgi:hypothetical protein